ncbi:MAG TPA: 50S ribosomal protein L18e [Candidatus Nanoarchaeia archaeon]|nr:50S ribosomal protein L18e [Candidatus Nanoarchaeia archaeon]
MKSATKIKNQAKRKTNGELVETILRAAKNEKWIDVARVISGPRRNRLNLNLDIIDREAKDGEKIIIPGKVLSQGRINKKIKLIALSFSENAKEKLSKEKIDFSTISEEIKKNPDAKGLRILK